MIDRVDVRRYRLPMRTPFRVHGATIGEREGWLIRVSAGEHHGLGEAAPLPWFGTETMQDAGEMLERARGLVGRSVDDRGVWYEGHSLPRLRRSNGDYRTVRLRGPGVPPPG